VILVDTNLLGAVVCSTDHDLARFPGIRHVNPLTSN